MATWETPPLSFKPYFWGVNSETHWFYYTKQGGRCMGYLSKGERTCNLSLRILLDKEDMLAKQEK